jgi:hypothetical protein
MGIVREGVETLGEELDRSESKYVAENRFV